MKITRNKLRQLISEQAGILPGINIVYDGYQNQYDMGQYDFVINGRPMSTRIMNSTNPQDIANELSELIAQAMGANPGDPMIEAQYDQMAINFLMSNQQFQSDIVKASRMQREYPYLGY